MDTVQSDNLTRNEAAEFLGVSPSFLGQDIVTHRHKIPHFKIGRKVIYSRSHLAAWKAARMVNAIPTGTTTAA